MSSTSACKPGAGPRIVLSYPDVYEIGISNPALQILYTHLNDATAAAAERAYCPWPDMASEMRSSGVPLWTLETLSPVAECDLWGFTLPHELAFTNVLEMLDLAGVPLHAGERDERRSDRPWRRAGGGRPLAAGRRSSTPSSWARSRITSTRSWRRWAHGRVASGFRGSQRCRASGARPEPAACRTPGLHGVLEHAARGASGGARSRGGARPGRRRGDARLQCRLPLLSGGHVVPARARASGRPGGQGRRPPARRDRLR